MKRVTDIPIRILWPSGLGTTLAVQQAVGTYFRSTGRPRFFSRVICKLHRGQTPPMTVRKLINDVTLSGVHVYVGQRLWHAARHLNRYKEVGWYERVLAEVHTLCRVLGGSYTFLDTEMTSTPTFPANPEGQRDKIVWFQERGPWREELWNLSRRDRWRIRRACLKAASSRYGRPVGLMYCDHGAGKHGGYAVPFRSLCGDDGVLWSPGTYKLRAFDQREHADNPRVWCSWVTTTPDNHKGSAKPLTLAEFFALELPDAVKFVGVYISKNDVPAVLEAFAESGAMR